MGWIAEAFLFDCGQHYRARWQALSEGLHVSPCRASRVGAYRSLAFRHGPEAVGRHCAQIAGVLDRIEDRLKREAMEEVVA